MSTLLERFRNTAASGNNITKMNAEEIADVLYCLCKAASEKKLIKAAPENTEILENGDIRISSVSEQNLYYAAPEEIFGIGGHDENAGWFTLGLLAYFVINGRSYYSARSLNVVDMKELKVNQISMIMADGIDRSAEDIPSLFNIAIERFTSWDASERPDGASYLLKAIAQFNSTASVQYVCSGQPVLHELISVNPPKSVIRKDTEITGTDGKKYKITHDINIPFRPGAHRISVEVCEIAGSQYEYYLFVKVPPKKDPMKLMKLGNTPELMKIEVIRDVRKEYQFYICVGDPVLKKVVGKKYKNSVGVPEMAGGGSSLLQVKYDPAAGVEISLYNREGTRMISDNVIKFTVE